MKVKEFRKLLKNLEDVNSDKHVYINPKILSGWAMELRAPITQVHVKDKTYYISNAFNVSNDTSKFFKYSTLLSWVLLGHALSEDYDVCFEIYTQDQTGTNNQIICTIPESVYLETKNGVVNIVFAYSGSILNYEEPVQENKSKESNEDQTVFTNKEINLEKENTCWIEDVASYLRDKTTVPVVECFQLFIPKEERRKGKASKLLQDYIKKNIGEDKLYFATAGASKEEYKTQKEFIELCNSGELDSLLKQLEEFYNKNGFLNVSKFIGGYEFKEMYLYMNDAAYKFLINILLYHYDCMCSYLLVDGKVYNITKWDIKENLLYDQTVNISFLGNNIIENISYGKFDYISDLSDLRKDKISLNKCKKLNNFFIFTDDSQFYIAWLDNNVENIKVFVKD